MTDREARVVVALGAAAASGEPERLVQALEATRDLVSVDDIEELLLQTYLFAGFPRTINAFFTWQRWSNEAGLGRGRLFVEEEAADGRRARGEGVCRLVYGDHYEALQARLARLHPALAEWTLVEGYGKVLGRPGPSPALRELAAVGALIELGAARQLVSHLRGARHAGVESGVIQSAARAIARSCDRESLVDEQLEAAF